MAAMRAEAFRASRAQRQSEERSQAEALANSQHQYAFTANVSSVARVCVRPFPIRDSHGFVACVRLGSVKGSESPAG